MIEISVPAWVPVSNMKLHMRQDNKTLPVITIARGEVRTVSMPIPPRGSLIDIDITPGFVPAMTGAGDDRRELTAILNKCEIVGSDRQTVTLFPESTSA